MHNYLKSIGFEFFWQTLRGEQLDGALASGSGLTVAPDAIVI